MAPKFMLFLFEEKGFHIPGLLGPIYLKMKALLSSMLENWVPFPNWMMVWNALDSERKIYRE